MPYEQMKLKVGIFVTLFFIFILSFSYFFLDKKGTFNKRYTYYIHTNSAVSFSVGMPINFSGFNIGTIDDIKLKDDGKVLMTITIDETYKKWVTINSSLALIKPLIGSAHIEFHKSKESEELEEGSSIEIKINDDINDLVTRFEPVVEKMTNIVVNLEKFSTRLANDDSLLTTITGDKEVTKMLAQSLKSMGKMLQNIEGITDNLDKDIVKPSSNSINNLNTILLDIQNKLKKLESSVDTVVGLNGSVETIKTQIEYATIKSNQLLDKIDSVVTSDEKPKMELP